jgi:hypothetical protein
MAFGLPRLALRTARHDWRGGLALAGGGLLCAALLTGAFATGNGLRARLSDHMDRRLAGFDHILYTGDRFVPDTLPDRARPAPGGTLGGAHLLLPGSVAAPDGSRRRNQIQILGLGPDSGHSLDFGPDGKAVWINAALARATGLGIGDELIARAANPGVLPREAVFSTEDDQTVALRGVIAGVLADGLADFSLSADLRPALTVFTARAGLQEAIAQPGRANLLLHRGPVAPEWSALLPADFGLTLVPATVGGDAELITDRVFLTPEAEAAAEAAGGISARVFTYFATALRAGDRTTPYSTVCALELRPAGADLLPADLGPDEIVINDWLAEDLGAQPGDRLTLEYLTMGAQRAFRPQEKAFTVRSVTRREGLAADRSLMPAFPGLADADHCRDWKAGIPVDMGKVRPKDEDYWEAHQGTPKAFLRLDTGQTLWGTDFGSLTAIRFLLGGRSLEELGRALVDRLDPKRAGLTWLDARERAQAAVAGGMDFGGLFAGMSFFLLVACLALAGMFAAWQVEERRGQIALLRATGFPRHRLRALLLGEFLLWIALGAALGPWIGAAYAEWLAGRMGGEWSAAAQGLSGSIRPSGGGGLGAGLAILVMGLTALGQIARATRGPVRDLLLPPPDAPVRRARALAPGGFGLLGALAIAVAAARAPAAQQPALAFTAGLIALLAGLALARGLLGDSRRPLAGLLALAASNLRRAGSKGLVTSGVLAAGLFLVGAAGAFRQEVRPEGTGGFPWVLDATAPLLRDLNDPAVQEDFGVDGLGLRVAAFRVQAGDEASCLNLLRAQQPRLLGVDPAALSGRFRFVFGEDGPEAWAALNRELPGGEIPAIADQNSLLWALHKRPGDTLDIVGEDGRPARLRLVGAVNNTLLQGALIVGEGAFRRLHPSTSGHRWFLAEASAPPEEFRPAVERALRDWGVQVTPAAEVLAAFHAVQNTYIDIFQVLGGLGLVLGSAGLTAVALRNLARRRREWAVLEAQGWPRRRLAALAWIEHGLLVAAGALIGGGAAALPVAGGGHWLTGLGQLVGWGAAMAAVAALGIALALRAARQGRLTDRLREE